MRSRQVVRLAAPLLVLALGAAACGGGGDDASDNSSATPTGSATSAVAKGGTLKVLSEEDSPHWDTPPAYDTNSYHILRTLQRQLYTNKSSNDDATRLEMQPDLADGLPKISSDGLTYTIKIKKDVKWNTPDARTITAADAVRGFQFMCNPDNPFGSPGFFTDLIEGYKDYCTAFGEVKTNDAAATKTFIEANQISGIKAVDDKTLEIKLIKPAGDLIHILALPTVSPRPVEALAYVVDTPELRQNIIESGPYQVESYTQDKSAVLTRNPNWTDDTVRSANPDRIELTFGVPTESIQSQIEAGTADVAFGNTAPPGPSLAQLGDDPRLEFHPTGGLNPYAAFNTLGGNPALKKVEVRQALNYAANKRALVQVAGGTKVASPATQIFTKSVVGDDFEVQDKYKSDGYAGDPEKAKSMLAAAGYPNGLTLKLTFRSSGNGPKYAAALQEDFKKAGVTLELVPQPNRDFYSNFIQKTSITQSGAWDIALPGWSPDWEGASERSFFTPLLDGRTYADGSTNYGKYDNADVNAKADAALAETDEKKAMADWNQIDGLVMDDAPWIPLILQTQANMHSARVSNFQYYFSGSNGDLNEFSIKQ